MHTHTCAHTLAHTHILTHGLLADNTAGLLDAWGTGGCGAALPHGCCLAWLVSAPAFREGPIHDLPLALSADTWWGKAGGGQEVSLHFKWFLCSAVFPFCHDALLLSVTKYLNFNEPNDYFNINNNVLEDERLSKTDLFLCVSSVFARSVYPKAAHSDQHCTGFLPTPKGKDTHKSLRRA